MKNGKGKNLARKFVTLQQSGNRDCSAYPLKAALKDLPEEAHWDPEVPVPDQGTEGSSAGFAARFLYQEGPDGK